MNAKITLTIIDAKQWYVIVVGEIELAIFDSMDLAEQLLTSVFD